MYMSTKRIVHFSKLLIEFLHVFPAYGFRHRIFNDFPVLCLVYIEVTILTECFFFYVRDWFLEGVSSFYLFFFFLYSLSKNVFCVLHWGRTLIFLKLVFDIWFTIIIFSSFLISDKG